MIKKLELTEEEILELRSFVEDKDILAESEIETLKKWRDELVDSIVFSKLFIKSYKVIKENIYFFDIEDKEEVVKKKDAIGKLIKELGFVPELRNLLEIYGDGTEWESYNIGLKIMKIVKDNREDMEYLISLFFKIFGDVE